MHPRKEIKVYLEVQEGYFWVKSSREESRGLTKLVKEVKVPCPVLLLVCLNSMYVKVPSMSFRSSLRMFDHVPVDCSWYLYMCAIMCTVILSTLFSKKRPYMFPFLDNIIATYPAMFAQVAKVPKLAV